MSANGAAQPTYVLGGYQTDFARNVTKEGGDVYSLLEEAVWGALEETQVPAAGRRRRATSATWPRSSFCGQAQLGGMVAAIDPALGEPPRPPATRRPARRRCVATLAAMADRGGDATTCALVVGVELMTKRRRADGGEHLGSRHGTGREATDARFPWPALFSEIADAYAERWGLEYEHLGRIAELNFANAAATQRAGARVGVRAAGLHPGRRSQPRDRGPASKAGLRSDHRRRGGGRARLPRYAAAHVGRTGRSLDDLPAIRGWGHRTAPMLLADKLARSDGSPYLFATPARGDHGRIPPRRNRRPGRPRPDRDPRLLHDHRVHGARPLRPHRAGRVLEGDRGGRDRARRQAAGEPERRPDRPRPSRSARPACGCSRRHAPGERRGGRGLARSTAPAPPGR